MKNKKEKIVEIERRVKKFDFSELWKFSFQALFFALFGNLLIFFSYLIFFGKDSLDLSVYSFFSIGWFILFIIMFLLDSDDLFYNQIIKEEVKMRELK